MAVQKRAHGVALRLWQRVQRELTDRDWTDTKFQEETGISRPTLDRLRTNLRPPRRATVKTLAEVFTIDIDEALVLAGIIEDDSPEPPREESTEDFIRRVQAKLREVDDLLDEMRERERRSVG